MGRGTLLPLDSLVWILPLTYQKASASINLIILFPPKHAAASDTDDRIVNFELENSWKFGGDPGESGVCGGEVAQQGILS